MNRNRHIARQYLGLEKETGILPRSLEQRRRAARRYRAEQIAKARRRQDPVAQMVREATNG